MKKAKPKNTGPIKKKGPQKRKGNPTKGGKIFGNPHTCKLPKGGK